MHYNVFYYKVVNIALGCIANKHCLIIKRIWWTQWESNPRPPACKTGALPKLSYEPIKMVLVRGLEPPKF